MTEYTADIIAKYIIARYVKKHDDITNFKLQKILYYVQGYFYKYFDKPAFSDSIIEWPLGPTVIKVFEQYNIGINAKLYLPNKEIDKILFEISIPSHIKVLQSVIDCSIGMSDFELTLKTRKELPNDITHTNQIISEHCIREYFRNNDPLNLNIEMEGKRV